MNRGAGEPTAWPAPAKLNLFLHVTGRRPDGYHTLQTVFQFVDFCDELRFSERQDGEVRRISEVPGVAPDDDLIVRAARRLQAFSGTRLGIDIEVDKRIPQGAGLGGGSSDAATTLVALNTLWELGLSLEELAGVGLELGADVPVFVYGRAAWGEGLGELLTPVELDEPWYVVVCPDCEVSTAGVFAAPDLTRTTARLKMPDFLGDGVALVGDVLQRTRNDCETVVRSQFRPVDEVLTWLGGRGQPRMTGTGSAVFVAVASQVDGEQMRRGLPANWRGVVARGSNYSPLHVRRRKFESRNERLRGAQ